MNAIFYLLRSGCAWRILLYFHLRKLFIIISAFGDLKDFWEHINAVLRTELRILCGRKPEPCAAVLDRQSIKTTEIPGVRGYDAGKKIKGRKRHILVNTIGLLLIVVVYTANIQDRKVVLQFWRMY